MKFREWMRLRRFCWEGKRFCWDHLLFVVSNRFVMIIQESQNLKYLVSFKSIGFEWSQTCAWGCHECKSTPKLLIGSSCKKLVKLKPVKGLVRKFCIYANLKLWRVFSLQWSLQNGKNCPRSLEEVVVLNLCAMQRLISIILLSVYVLVSFLGQAGFDVLGLHSHGQDSSKRDHCTLKCCHCHHGQKTIEHSENDSRTPPEHADDCSICKCFCLFKMQLGASIPPTVTSVFVCCESFDGYERLVLFDFTFLPSPRGPPALQV